MKRWVAAFLLLMVVQVHAQKHAKTLLWQVSGKGMEKPSYIYGTFHLMCPKDLVVSKTLRDRFNETKQLYLEINMDDPSIIQQLLSNTTMRNDTTLKQLLSASEYDSLSSKFQKLTGIPLMLMNSMKPFFTMSAVFPSLLQCGATEGWEKKFMDMASANDEKVYGLETVKDQLDVVDSIPYTVQAQMLLKTLMNIDSTKQSLQQLVKVYKEKDLEKINELTKADEEFGQYDDVMIEKRNKNWIPAIIEQASKTPTFFAVGAGHLGGEKGILELLRKKGYTVKPVLY